MNLNRSLSFIGYNSVYIFLLISSALFSQQKQKIGLSFDQLKCGIEELALFKSYKNPPCAEITPCHDPNFRDSYLYDPSQPVKVVKTIVQVIRETDGSNPSATDHDVALQFHHLNLNFEPFGIQFTYQINYIDDSSIKNVSTIQEQFDIMVSNIIQSNEFCNIFVGGGVASFAFYPWNTNGHLGIFMNAGVQFYPGNNRSSLTHEMGHALGLYHTFTGYNELTCTDDCAENMGAVGDLVGDFCSDTPPQESNFNHGFTPSIDICTNDPFIEIPHENYLSYSDCKTTFTPQQAARMHCYLDTDPKRINWLDLSNPAIPYIYSDEFGYSYIQEENLNPFDWVDITTSGTQIAGLLDDNIIGPIDLEFDLDFYGEQFSQIYIGSNGYISFSPIQINTIGGQFPSIPTADGKDGFFAPFLADLNFTGTDNQGKVYFYSNQLDYFVITFEKVPFYNLLPGQPAGFSGSNTFQMIFSAQNNEQITYQYQEMDEYYPYSYTQTSNPSLIGIESPDGQIGLEVNNYQIPKNNSRVIIGKTSVNINDNNYNRSSLYQAFPNPVFKELSIQLNSTYLKLDLSFYNVMGQELDKQKFLNTDLIITDISLKPGVYYLHIIGDRKNLGSVKILKL